MPTTRQPLHEVFFSILDLAGVICPDAFHVISFIANRVTIPDNHDRILKKIDEEISLRPSYKPALLEIKREVLAQKAEAEARKAEMANQVTDAERLKALVELSKKSSGRAATASIDDLLSLVYNFERMATAKTRDEFNKELAKVV